MQGEATSCIERAMVESEVSLKVMVLGDAGTGKTSLIKRYVHNFFTDHHKTTVGVDYHLAQLFIGAQNVRLQMWDIAGQERYGHMSRVYYKNSVGAILVYDVSRPITFESVSRWKEEIDNRVLLPDGSPIPVLLLGNKCDLEDAEIDKAQLDRYCAEHGFIGWFDTSAKHDINISKACRYLVTEILKYQELFMQHDSTSAFTPGIDIATDNRQNLGAGCC